VKHPNAAVGGGSSGLGLLVVWALGHFGVALSPEEGAAVAGVIATVALFVGRHGLQGSPGRSGAAVSEMSDEPQVVQVVSDEQLQVLRNRYAEARAAGLSIVEAQLFRDSLTDVGLLRRCVRNGWTPEQIARVVTGVYVAVRFPPPHVVFRMLFDRVTFTEKPTDVYETLSERVQA
jgi:hypothetical protein